MQGNILNKIKYAKLRPTSIKQFHSYCIKPINKTIKEIRNNPWIKTPCDMKQFRENILADLAEIETVNRVAIREGI